MDESDLSDELGTPTAQRSRPNEPPRVRLATWVNVVLILVLFASCAGADRVDSRITGPSSDAEMEQVCQVLVAIAAKDGVDLDQEVFHGSGDGPCAQAWQARQGQ